MAEPSARRDPFALPDVSGLVVGVLGGTGEQGQGLARRWAIAGLSVIIGSRDPQRADRAAAQLRAELGEVRLSGSANADCAARSDVVVVAVPWAGHGDLLAALSGPLAGKIVVDCVNPMGFDSAGAFALAVPEGSAAQQAAVLLPEATVTAAFHHVSAVVLSDPEAEKVDTDVMVLGDDRAATDVVAALANLIPGMRGLYAGRLRNAHQVEALTANLISVNRRYRSHAGVRLTDV